MKKRIILLLYGNELDTFTYEKTLNYINIQNICKIKNKKAIL